MNEEPDRTTDDELDGKRASHASRGVEGVGTYETADAVVFYDADNPLAWVQTSEAVGLEEMA